MADIRAFDIDVETKQTPCGVSLKRVERGDGKFLKALITMVADENGLLPGEVGYTEPVNKSLLVDAAGKSPGDVGYTGPIVQANITSSKISGTVVSGGTDPTAVFANNAGANTQATPITITKPTNVSQMHQISVYNPSTVTDLTVKVFTVATSLGGG